MASNSEIIEILNDLILINNDRVVGYEKAYDETKESDTDLRSLFNSLANDSREYVTDLTREVRSLGGEPATGTMLSGKLYRAWMDVKATFTSNERKTALENSEFGEDAAQRAYEAALQSDALTPELRDIVNSQKAALLKGHDTVKRMRDAERMIA